MGASNAEKPRGCKHRQDWLAVLRLTTHGHKNPTATARPCLLLYRHRTPGTPASPASNTAACTHVAHDQVKPRPLQLRHHCGTGHEACVRVRRCERFEGSWCSPLPGNNNNEQRATELSPTSAGRQGCIRTVGK